MPESMPHGPLSWGCAESPAELEEVYLFRYAHYYRNLPAAPGVDHKAGRVYLPIDQVSSHLTGRDADGALIIVGTGTRASTPGLPSEWREILRLDTLTALNLDRILIFARLVERESCRGSTNFPVFFRFGVNHFMERGYVYSIHYCAPALVPMYERAGYTMYGPGYTMRSGLYRVPMILTGATAPYSARDRSRSAVTAQGVSPADSAIKNLRQALPETGRLSLCALSGEERLRVVRALLAPNLGAGAAVEECIPDAAARILRRSSLLALAPGDRPSHPVDQPLFWFILEGEMMVRLPDGSDKRVFPGSFVNGRAITSCRALDQGRVIICAQGKAPESGEAVLPAEFWQSLASASPGRQMEEI